MKGKFFVFFSFFLLLSPFPAFSFPENIRQGYVNCMTCHYSPSGGGILTPYGRELSREALSTWGAPGKEAQPFYGAIHRPSWLDLGGDARAVQMWRDNPYVTEAKFIPMQMDLEAVAKLRGDQTKNQVIMEATYGIIPERKGNSTRLDKWGSRRHWILYRPIPEVGIRSGKFLSSRDSNMCYFSTQHNFNGYYKR